MTHLLAPARGIFVLAGIAVAVLVTLAGPAHGHTRIDEYSVDIASTITAEPDLPGVEWELHGGGLLVEATNDGPSELIVLGYEGEPYLRIGPEGAAENRHSPARYLNAERYGDVAVPPVADPALPPDWILIDDEPRAVWHDHRTHWMSPEAPSAARADPSRAHHVADWRLPFTHDGDAQLLEGEMWWLPAPSPWLFLLGGIALTAPALLSLRRSPSADPPSARRMLRPAAVVVGVVALANTAHLPDEVLAYPQPTLDVLSGMLHTSIFLIAGLGGAAVAWRGGRVAPAALGIASAALLFHQGLLHLAVLGAAVLPTSLPEAAFRLLVAASLVQAAPVAIVLLAARRRGPGREEPSRADEEHSLPERADA